MSRETSELVKIPSWLVDEVGPESRHSYSGVIVVPLSRKERGLVTAFFTLR